MPDNASIRVSLIAMDLDVNTLFMVTMHVEIMLGLLLFFAWAQNFSKRALGLVGQRPSDARGLDHAAWPVRLGAGFAFDRSRQRGAVRLVRADLVRRAGVRPAQPGAGPGACSASRSGCSHAASQTFATSVELARAARLRNRDRLYLGSRPMNSGAAATRRWCRAGPRSSCCSPTARCSCCARRSAR